MFIICDKDDEASLDLAYKRLSAVHQKMLSGSEKHIDDIEKTIMRDVLREVSIEVDNKASETLEDLTK